MIAAVIVVILICCLASGSPGHDPGEDKNVR